MQSKLMLMFTLLVGFMGVILFSLMVSKTGFDGLATKPCPYGTISVPHSWQFTMDHQYSPPECVWRSPNYSETGTYSLGIPSQDYEFNGTEIRILHPTGVSIETDIEYISFVKQGFDRYDPKIVDARGKQGVFYWVPEEKYTHAHFHMHHEDEEYEISWTFGNDVDEKTKQSIVNKTISSLVLPK